MYIEIMTEDQSEKVGSIKRIGRHAKRLAIAVIGSTVLLFGIGLLVLPGPGILVILAGLGILAVEFAWAKRLLEKGKAKLKRKKRQKGA